MNPATITTFFPVPLFLAGAAFLAVVYIILLFSRDRREELRAIVETYSRDTDQEERRRTVAGGSFWERIGSPVLGAVAGVFASTAPADVRARTAQRLALAGNPIDVSTFLALRGLLLFGLPLSYAVFVITSRQPWGPPQLIILIAAILLGRMLPDTLLRIRTTARQKRIERSIPDAVDLIVACVEAGLSLDGALMKVAERMSGPLGDEIARALHEMRMGRPRRDALKDVATRTGVQSLQSFSQAISHAERMGISIADVLRTLADDLRTKRKLRAQEMAQKAPVKMIPVIIVCIMPSLFVVVLGPAIITIIDAFKQ